MHAVTTTPPRTGVRAAFVLGCLAASALALVLAPSVLPESYSWVEHTTSEAGAQGVEGAWLARTGFVLFGVAVLAMAALPPSAWSVSARTAHGVFGLAMLAVAAFSTRPWFPDATFDATEDLLHSVAATAMGFAFAFGVVFVAIRIGKREQRVRWFDAAAVVATVVLPLGMTFLPDFAGLFQRLMFAVAYAWYVRSALEDRAPVRPS